MGVMGVMEVLEQWSNGKRSLSKTLMLERFFNTPILRHSITQRTVEVGKVFVLKARPKIKAQ
jgi:hypothetical protein